MRIGVLGGSFDPPHHGHVLLAQSALETLSLDEVMFLPARRNPLKSSPTSATSADRLEMTRLTIEKYPGFSVCDLDLVRPGPSYAVQTLTELQVVRPAVYWFIVGVDALRRLAEWKHPERLVKLCRFAAAPRASLSVAEVLPRLPEVLRSHVDELPMLECPISSTDVRERISGGRPIGGMLEPGVEAFVRREKLYRG